MRRLVALDDRDGIFGVLSRAEVPRDQRLEHLLAQAIGIEPDNQRTRGGSRIRHDGHMPGTVVDLLDERNRDDERGRRCVHRIGHENREPGCGSRRTLPGHALAPLDQRRRPFGRLQRTRGWIESLKGGVARSLRLEQEDLTNQSGPRRHRLHLVEPVRDRSRKIAIERVRLEMEGEIHARQLAIEFLAEIGRARLQTGTHARALRFADLTDPPVLEYGERDQQHHQDRACDQLPGRSRSIVEDPHEITVRELRRADRTLYISYKTIAQR